MSTSEGKVAIVTGAPRGIGKAIAERLAGDGFAVLVNYARSAGPAEALVRTIVESGGRASAFKADVSDPAAVHAMFDATETQFGGVDVLVNNAGILLQSNIADTSDSDFDKLVTINLSGIYAATKAAVETMTSIMAKELRGRNITVNAVAPGPTATDMFLKGKPPELIQQIAKVAPLERLGTPEDIAAVVGFLAGPEAGWINGQTLRVNGGYV